MSIRNTIAAAGTVLTIAVTLSGRVMAAAPDAETISPTPGSTDVDPKTTAIVVSFDQPMGKGMSWTGGGPHFPKTDESQKAGWVSDTTCVLPVSLEAGKVYRVGLNSTSFQNFRSASDEPLPPQAIMFATAGAAPEDIALMAPPKVTVFDPPNESKTVDPGTSQIAVTFDQPMGDGVSWTGGGENFPETTGAAEWSQDKRTCTIPVKLKANHSYKLGVNSVSHKNFQNTLGVPADPVSYEFKTAD